MKAQNITQKMWYRQLLMREKRFGMLPRLMSEYVCDMYCRLIDEQLLFYKTHLNQPRKGTSQSYFLPKTFLLGSQAYRKYRLDSLELVRRYGKPTYFITLTANPQWAEFLPFKEKYHNIADRPDIVCRIFHAKLMKMINYLKSSKSPFGRYIYLVCVIEYQKRGWPHVHIALKTTKEPSSAIEVDSVISAVVPLPDDPIYHLVVSKMMHKCNSHCLRPDGTCRKHFPAKLSPETFTDKNGFTHYKRITPSTPDSLGGDRVVPYNREVLLKWGGHSNVTISFTVKLIGYLFKYLFKGVDTANCEFKADQNASVDQIEHFRRHRYFSAAEACWNIFGFRRQQRWPGVRELKLHAPEDPEISDTPSDDSETAAPRPTRKTVSDLNRYFCRPYIIPRTETTNTDTSLLTYQQYFELFTVAKQLPKTIQYYAVDRHGASPYFVYHKNTLNLTTRITFLYPTVGELFYLRQILLHFPRWNFDDCKIVEGVTLPTYQSAASELGLLYNAEQETHILLNDMVTAHFVGHHMRLVLSMLSICEGAPFDKLFQCYQDYIIADILPRMLEKYPQNSHDANVELAKRQAFDDCASYFIESGHEHLLPHPPNPSDNSESLWWNPINTPFYKSVLNKWTSKINADQRSVLAKLRTIIKEGNGGAIYFYMESRVLEKPLY